MKLAFSLLMCLAAASLLPAQAACKVASYDEAQARLNDEGYLVFYYGKGWDKRAGKQITQLYNAPEIIKAAGNAVMMLVPLGESLDEAGREALKKTMGKLRLPPEEAGHSFPAVVLYDKTGRFASIICGPPMVYPDAKRVAALITARREALARQLDLLAQADKAQGQERARMLLQACQIPGLQRPDRAEQRIKEADPEDASGCLAALRFHNNPMGEKIDKMTLTEALAELDKAIANPLHTVQQKQNACAFAIGTIRRRVGMGGSALIRQYAEQMKQLAPDSVLGRSADVVIRDWTSGLQLVRGWAPDTLPMQGVPTELQGKLPIAAAATYNVRFTPTGGRNHARVTRVELLDGDTSLSVDDRDFTLTSPASYYVTASLEVKNPRILVTFDNNEKERDTRGKITITVK